MALARDSSKRKDLILTVGLAIASLTLYLRTLVPGLIRGDSGEFQTLARLLGHTHPTGYPVYLVMAHPLTWLPVHGVAYWVNAFSALMAAIAVAGMYLAARHLTPHRVLALVAAITLAVAPTFWSQAIIAEVYTPGAAFFIAIVGLILHWQRTHSPTAIFLAGWIGGLSLGVHMTVALLAPAAILVLLLEKGIHGRTWRAAVMGALIGVGMTWGLFWEIDARHARADYFRQVVEPSASAWGLRPEDIDDPWERLRFHWTAQQFRPFMFQKDAFPKLARGYLRHLPSELSYPMIILALLGGGVLAVRRPRVAAFLGTGLAGQWAFTLTYAIWDLYVFWIPGYILLILLAVAGLDAIARRGKRRRLVVGLIALVILASVLGPVPRIMWTSVARGTPPPFPFEEYPHFDPRLESQARHVVSALPERAIVFTDWDMIWPYTYAAYILEVREDLTFIETYPLDDQPGLADSLIRYVRDLLDTHPIFFSERDARLRAEGWRLIPVRVGGARFYRVKTR